MKYLLVLCLLLASCAKSEPVPLRPLDASITLLKMADTLSADPARRKEQETLAIAAKKEVEKLPDGPVKADLLDAVDAHLKSLSASPEERGRLLKEAREKVASHENLLRQ